jgi:hypothetical protein
VASSNPMRTAQSLFRLVFILFALAHDALRFLLLGTLRLAKTKSAFEINNLKKGM